ncbi:conserved protein of unknown function [Kyrpidia spormannii]|uniref:DUF6431 domain-containing protein n=3 Tax=Kyrpidia spormannii TaxID=2055160 RepID=A0A6F9DZA2_9BACL|nr:conserved protein of unknown function [Kyrpidia spormannii]CAB3390444.1 conserved protein of unknown function [Kyrpidia spormannii]CAB3394577.1 conserved protein of unknown function [Kyrpidia spormannii]CAB3395509.1 conserved protein of unknown function [Kyrpidia spormannii]
MPCPCCEGALGVIGSRRRGCVRASGEKIQLIIRRLRCGRCRRIHHELPDILVPYKRHEALGIEAAVSEPPADHVGAEESTLRRWRHWFAGWAPYAAGCLNALAHRFGFPVESSSTCPQSALRRIGRLVGEASGWLARAVRPMANANLWVQTRSACLSSTPSATFKLIPHERGERLERLEESGGVGGRADADGVAPAGGRSGCGQGAGDPGQALPTNGAV